MDIAPERFDKIARLARSLWVDYVTSLDSPVHEDAVLNPGRLASNLIAGFFRFCAAILVSEPGATAVDANIVISTLGYVAPAGGEPPASWLVSIRDSVGCECPTIVVDHACLNQHLSYDAAMRAKNHLLLHEIGHLVLHWDLIHRSPPPGQQRLARAAFPKEEAEAWWFCYALLGYIVAKCAYSNKKDPKNADDQIWRLRMR